MPSEVFDRLSADITAAVKAFMERNRLDASGMALCCDLSEATIRKIYDGHVPMNMTIASIASLAAAMGKKVRLVWDEGGT